MSRETCYRCFWPKSSCWCSSIQPMATDTKFVFLMHPKEFKREKANTGRLTHLCLANSEIQMGTDFDHHQAVQEIIADPRNFPVLLYPGVGAHNLSRGSLPAGSLVGRRLVIFLLDATWACARKMLRLSPSLQRLPRVVFTATALSRYIIKQQPQEGCLSTLEATHEILLALEQSGLDRYPLPAQLLDLFDRMQKHQIACATDPKRPGYRRSAYKHPSTRKPAEGRSARRNRFIRPDSNLAPVVPHPSGKSVPLCPTL